MQLLLWWDRPKWRSRRDKQGPVNQGTGEGAGRGADSQRRGRRVWETERDPEGKGRATRPREALSP